MTRGLSRLIKDADALLTSYDRGKLTRRPLLAALMTTSSILMASASKLWSARDRLDLMPAVCK